MVNTKCINHVLKLKNMKQFDLGEKNFSVCQIHVSNRLASSPKRHLMKPGFWTTLMLPKFMCLVGSQARQSIIQ